MDIDRIMENLLKLLLYVLNGYEMSVAELAEKLNKSSRTIERYTKKLREFGIEVKIKNQILFIAESKTNSKLLQQVLRISPAEAILLNNALDKIEAPASVKSTLQQKLNLFDSQKIIDCQVKAEKSETTEAINSAIKNREQVLFKNYASGSSGTSDRLVEPFEFKNNLKYVMCYEPAKEANRLFKIKRIEQCIPAQTLWEHEEKHESLPTDVFRICGELNKPVKLKLTSLARNLLIEEYPQSECYISACGDSYIFETAVAGFLGISRFCMGLPDNVEVLESDKLKEFMRKRQKK